MSSTKTIDFNPLNVDEATLAEITALIVRVYDPVKVYLFGSYARGEATRDSDIDIMVVLPDDAAEELQSGGPFRANSRGRDWPVEIHTGLKSWFERRQHLPVFFPATIVREGRLLYGA